MFSKYTFIAGLEMTSKAKTKDLSSRCLEAKAMASRTPSLDLSWIELYLNAGSLAIDNQMPFRTVLRGFHYIYIVTHIVKSLFAKHDSWNFLLWDCEQLQWCYFISVIHYFQVYCFSFIECTATFLTSLLAFNITTISYISGLQTLVFFLFFMW